MGNASILYMFPIFCKITYGKGLVLLVIFNIETLLKKNNRSKYWLCQQMNITSRNINRLINGETTSISFKYIEQFCKLLNCTAGELITVIDDDQE